MAEWSDTQDKLTLKLVFYGPALSGKTTNLMRLHDLIASDKRGDMMVLDTQNDRTLFFDLLPLGFRSASGLLIKLKIYTVPGQVQHDSTRKAVLSRCDGIVFVADSQRTQATNNGLSFESLAANLQKLGSSVETTPVVVQFNKRDLPEIFSEQELNERWRNSPWLPLQFACAMNGSGVAETFAALLRKVYDHLDDEVQWQTHHRLSADAFVAGLLST